MFLTISAFGSYFIFCNFQAYVLFRNSTIASSNYHWCLKILAKNILLSKNKASWQQPRTKNFECLAVKHVMFGPDYNIFFPYVCLYMQPTVYLVKIIWAGANFQLQTLDCFKICVLRRSFNRLSQLSIAFPGTRLNIYWYYATHNFI